MMKVWPFDVALRGEMSNHLMLRWLMTVVVSDEEKASVEVILVCGTCMERGKARCRYCLSGQG